MGNIIYFSDHVASADDFEAIAPLIRELFQSMGGDESLAQEVILEYQSYLKQLSLLSNEEQLNHACHIILGLLIKEKLGGRII